MLRPMKASIGLEMCRYLRLASRTAGSSVNMLTQRSGNIDSSVPITPRVTKATARGGPGDPPRPRDAVRADRHADHRRRADTDRKRNRRQHEFEPRADAVAGQHLGAERASKEVRIVMVTTDCNGEKTEIAPTFRMSKNISRRNRKPFRVSLTRLLPDIKNQLITRMLTENADQRSSRNAAQAELRKRAKAERKRAAEADLDCGGGKHQRRRQLHVAGAAQDRRDTSASATESRRRRRRYTRSSSPRSARVRVRREGSTDRVRMPASQQ